jgi:sirohydrochlorin ferrochelatase
MKGKSRIVSNGRTLRKIIGMLLAVAMVVALLPITAYATFSDVQGHWGQTAIEKWSDMEIVQGWDGAFRPNAPITRGEMAVIIDRVMKYQTKSKNSFSDLGSAFYTDAILKANAAGVIKGDGTTVRPMDNITREEAAVMLGRALGLSENPNGGTAFSDYTDISGWAVGGVNAMANKGYVKGFNAAFHPKRSITRAEVVAILDNSIKQLYNGNKEYTGNVSGTAIVNTPGAVLKDMKISGDLIIAEGVGDGDITLNNVTVAGNTLLRGGGSDSIHIQGGSQISNLIIEKTDNGAIRVVTSGGAVVETVWVDDGRDDIILTGSFESITVAADVTVKAVDAKIERVEVTVKNAVLDVDKESAIDALNVTGTAANTEIKVFGKVGTLTADAKISVNNQGIIARAQINANDVSINGNAPATMNVAATVTTRPATGSAPSSDGSSGGGGGGGSSSPSFAGGSGTESSPYQIAAAAQLDQVRNYLDKHFVLTADIDLSGYENWTPIGVFDHTAKDESGYFARAFAGTFDGGGHTISNLTIHTAKDSVGVALFGANTSSAKVKNLTVNNAVVDGGMTIGGIVGYNCGAAENLTLKGKNTISGVNCTGGIIGGHQFGSVKNCHVEDATINVLGDNDFSSGPIIQCDVAECGGLIIGGAFTGSIENCSARGKIAAAGQEPVGLGGIGGCLEYMESITGCTADVTITAPNSAHAVGGLCGYAGTGDTNKPAFIKDCSVKFVMNTANATHTGGLVGTGLYYMGMETVFSISNCSAAGQINGAVTPGTIAGRAQNCTITDCRSDVLIDGVKGTAEIGTTERMYESADQAEGFENLSAWANRGSGSFESLVNYVNDDALNDVWNAAASSEMAQMMAGMFGATVTDGASLKAMFANMASTPANNGTQIYQIKFAYDYKTIYFCDNDGHVIASHPYTFVERNDNLGMLAGETTYVFKADDDAGVLTYMAMLKPHFDEGMDETTMPAHIHFYYAATKDTLGTYKPDSVTLNGWMPTMLQMGDEFSTADKTALLKCLFGINNAPEEPVAATGILVVAHGSDENWNQRVRESVTQVEVPYPVELGFLDVETENIAMAVQALEQKGVKRIVAVPIFVCSASSHMEEIKYMLGLPSSLNDEAAQKKGLERIEKTATVELTPALDDHLLVAEIINERLKNLSQNPEKEIVVLVAHGTSDPENLAVWKEKMASLGDKLQQIQGFKQVCCGFVGAGTPKIRTVVEEVKNSNPDCTVIVMPVMLSAGVYTDSKIPTSLEGITYLYPEAGQRALLPHANIAKYIAFRANDAIMGDIEMQESGQLYVVQYSDVALEEGGKVCVCGSLAYRAMQEALEVLSPGTVAERSRFTVLGPKSKGTEAALQAILGDGRFQLEERPHNEAYYSYQITDCERGTILTVKARPEVFSDNFFALKTKIKNNTATSEEKKAFQVLRAQVVEKVRWEEADNLFAIEAGTAFAGGSGTQSDPYQIATAA